MASIRRGWGSASNFSAGCWTEPQPRSPRRRAADDGNFSCAAEGIGGWHVSIARPEHHVEGAMLQKTPETAQSAPASSLDGEIGAVLAGGRKSGRRRRLWIVGAVVVVALAGLGAWLMSGSGGPSVVYTTQPVTQGDLTVAVTATGTVEPTNEVTISSEQSGTVGSVLVDYNDTVKKGQVLAKLDTDTLAANLALAEATLAVRRADTDQAQATVAETDLALKRAGDLVARKVSSQSTLEFGAGRQRPRQGGAGQCRGQ